VPDYVYFESNKKGTLPRPTGSPITDKGAKMDPIISAFVIISW